MKNIGKLFLSALALVALFGCAHPISMKPNLNAIKAEGAVVIDKQVGYHIPDASIALEITSPGGGGDKVRYFPYRDMEAGFYKVLSEAFKGVTKVVNPKDSAEIAKSGVTLLITPEITTTSFSPSIVTWPPTVFTVTLNCVVVDAKGQKLTTVRVQGDGLAEFSEFKGNFSLSAVRASEDALKKLMKALADSKELRQ